MATLGISEILKKAAAEKKKADRVRVLKENANQQLINFLFLALNPSVKWLLPESDPPYKPNDLVDLHSVLYEEMKRMYLFIEVNGKKGHETIQQSKRETLFVQLLENLDKEDARLLVAAKDKKLPFKTLTEDVIKEAFPGIIP